MNVRIIISIVFFVQVHVCAFSAFAASTLTLTPSGDGVFLLQGDGLADVAALDITITYDALALSSPQVSQGDLITGAMMAVNPDVTGIVRIAIITTNPIRGHGNIAKVTFSRIGRAEGGITSLRAVISNLSGSPLPVVTQVHDQSSASTSAFSTPSNQGSTSITSNTTIAVPTSPYTGGNRTAIGGVVTPQVETIIPEKQELPTTSEPRIDKVKETPSAVEAVISKEVITTPGHRVASKEKAVFTQKSC